MQSQYLTGWSRHLVALPLVAVGVFWALLALLGVLDLTNGPSSAVWAVALWGAVGFVALAVVWRVVLLAALMLFGLGRWLRRPGT